MSQFHLRRAVYLFNSSRDVRGFLFPIQWNFIENFIRGRFSEVNFPWKRRYYLFSSFLFNSWPMRNRVGKARTFLGGKRKIPSFPFLFRKKKSCLDPSPSPFFFLFSRKLPSTRRKNTKVESVRERPFIPLFEKSLFDNAGHVEDEHVPREIFPPPRIHREGDVVS